MGLYTNPLGNTLRMIKSSKIYNLASEKVDDTKDWLKENFTPEGQRTKMYENTDFDSLDGMSAEDQVKFVEGLRDKLPSGAKMADSFDKLGLDMSRTSESGEYSVNADSIGYGEGKALGIMDESGNLDKDGAMQMLNTDYDSLSDDQKAAMSNVADINSNIMNYAYNSNTGAPLRGTDAGDKVGDLLENMDEVDDFKNIQDKSIVGKSLTVADLVNQYAANSETLQNATIKIDSDSMEQYGAYASMMEAAKNGELTPDMAKESLATAYGLDSDSLQKSDELQAGNSQDGITVNGKTITKDDLKALFNTKEGQQMMVDATDEWESEMLAENPMLSEQYGKSDVGKGLTKGAEAGLDAGSSITPLVGTDGRVYDMPDLDGMDLPDASEMFEKGVPAKSGEGMLGKGMPELHADKHKSRVEQAEALSDGIEGMDNGPEMQML